MEKKDIRSYTFEQLQKEMQELGEKAFRSRQIYSWLHEKLADSFDEMTNLSKTLREKLDEKYEIRKVSMLERQISAMDGTNKFLFELQARLRWTGLQEIWSRRRCWDRFMRYRRFQENGFPI